MGVTKPELGSIVHYRVKGKNGKEDFDRAGIVVEIRADEMTCVITIFPGCANVTAKYDQGLAAETWHWPNQLHK